MPWGCQLSSCGSVGVRSRPDLVIAPPRSSSHITARRGTQTCETEAGHPVWHKQANSSNPSVRAAPGRESGHDSKRRAHTVLLAFPLLDETMRAERLVSLRYQRRRLHPPFACLPPVRDTKRAETHRHARPRPIATGVHPYCRLACLQGLTGLAREPSCPGRGAKLARQGHLVQDDVAARRGWSPLRPDSSPKAAPGGWRLAWARHSSRTMSECWREGPLIWATTRPGCGRQDSSMPFQGHFKASWMATR